MSISVNRYKWTVRCNVKPLVIRAILPWSCNVVTLTVDTMVPLGKKYCLLSRQWQESFLQVLRFPFSVMIVLSNLIWAKAVPIPGEMIRLEAGCVWVNEQLDNFQSESAGATWKRLAALEWIGGSCLEWGKSLVKTRGEVRQKKYYLSQKNG